MTRPLPTEDFDAPVVLGDRYELSELLGRGGMAEVYAARDRKLGRSVAVKLLPAGRRDDGVDTRRLEDEARSAAALNHPHAVAVHDVGSSPHGVFVVMERLEGRTWREELARRGRLAESEVIEPAAAVCDALAAAHDLGIVHRDVNPGNVMVRPDGVAKLMDFGIARVTATSPELTATGVVVGTAAYMSPEQVRDRTLDGRSDVYSLGCTLYELLTGRVPFEGTSSVEVASARLRDTPAPPRRLVGEVSGGMEKLIMAALALDPPRRPDAREMAAGLRALTGSSGPRDPGSGVSGTGGGPGPGGPGPGGPGPGGLGPGGPGPRGAGPRQSTAGSPKPGPASDAPAGGTAATTRLGGDQATDVVSDARLAEVPDAEPPSAEGPAVGAGMRRAGTLLVVLGVVALVAAVVVLLLLT